MKKKEKRKKYLRTERYTRFRFGYDKSTKNKKKTLFGIDEWSFFSEVG